jgi:hypothetical protein
MVCYENRVAEISELEEYISIEDTNFFPAMLYRT